MGLIIERPGNKQTQGGLHGTLGLCPTRVHSLAHGHRNLGQVSRRGSCVAGGLLHSVYAANTVATPHFMKASRVTGENP